MTRKSCFAIVAAIFSLEPRLARDQPYGGMEKQKGLNDTLDHVQGWVEALDMGQLVGQ